MTSRRACASVDRVPPSTHVLDLFAVPEDVQPLPGGSGGSVRSGDLVLSPGRDAAVQAWLSPVLARLAVRLDERPGRHPRDVRLAMPVPARDGSWVVDGWAASRWEPGTVACEDLDVVLAAGRLLHAELAVAVPHRPEGLEERPDRWAYAERLAFEPALLPELLSEDQPALVRRIAALLDATTLGPDQLVHADLAGNVLLDATLAPVVIDVSPAWRPTRWAEAVCVLDAVLWHDAAPELLTSWHHGSDRQAMLRAVLFRVLSDEPCDLAAYERVLAPLLEEPS